MSLLLTYIFLGISLAAPIGPVNAAQLDRGIKNGFLNSWLVGLGATVADTFYMLLVFLGVYHLIEIPFIQSFLWIFGSFLLIYTGIESLSSAKQIPLKGFDMNREAGSKSFLAGFFISLFNPLTILFWLGIFGSIIAKTVTSYDTEEVILYVSAIFVGITLWDFTMAGLSSTLRKFLTYRLLTAISVFSGVSLFGFGIYFAIQAATVLFS
ncbi:LysE family transporter [Texcoconibacillus texcoconensis]|uniref:Threonine/homoserine/homoserine lactone efflux protein n=1 Tax=Texcoconibacillus texcoconensis TaxID=1095777 RepID=A0A840QUT4_9BACI|nr:LysE family transporter [Texcoconibacillus texcoconensis]MBB5175114.1 threonine/homoserine/homoserine lactone efflux protein [Texcoconibacillus texcoconensis]